MSNHASSHPVAEKAVHNFVNDSFNCAEGVVAAVSEADGLAPRAHTAMAGPFGGGIGSLGHVCGAITGALMMIGKHAAEESAPRAEIRRRAQLLYQRFEATFGATDCRTLTAHDCNAAGGAPYDIRNCAKYLRLATETALEVRGTAAQTKAG